MKPEIEYLPDDSVDKALDLALRSLLTTCFLKPEAGEFMETRYFKETCQHRWMIRGEREAIVAHVAVHEKQVEAEGSACRIGGIAEVCVHPDYRGKGYVRLMLRHVHAWLSEQGFVFAVLFGHPRVYSSSGYVKVTNLLYGGAAEGWTQTEGMVKELTETPWPTGDVYLPGPTF